MKRRSLWEYIALGRHDSRAGHGYGSTSGGWLQGSVAEKWQDLFPYRQDHDDIDDSVDDLDDIFDDEEDMDKLVAKINGAHLSADPHAPGHVDRRYFAGPDTRPGMAEGIGRGAARDAKGMGMTYPQQLAKGNAMGRVSDSPGGLAGRKTGPAIGGSGHGGGITYRTGPERRTGTLQGWSKKPLVPSDIDEEMPLYSLKDLFFPEELSPIRAKIQRDIAVEDPENDDQDQIDNEIETFEECGYL